MPETIDSARRLVKDRLREVEAEARQLERALKALGERHRGRPGPAKPRRNGPTGKRRVRSQAPRGQRREQLLAAIKAQPGARPSELATEIGISPGQVSVLLAKARAEKLVVKKGAGYTVKG